MHALDHVADMTRYADWKPTGFDPAGLGCEDRQTWIVAPYQRDRDSGIRAQSDFDRFLEIIGGEGEHVEVHRFGHWACGWFEIILVDPDAPESVLVALGEHADGEIVDEDDVSRREEESKADAWNSMSVRDRAELLSRHPYVDVSIFAARHSFDRLMSLYSDALDSSGWLSERLLPTG